MRFRSFIGLILLIFALVVASTPALLTPAAKRVEQLAITTGVLDPGTPNATRVAASKRKTGSVPSKLELKGYEVTKNELKNSFDLKDDFPDSVRAANRRSRLAGGSERQRLPGQLRLSDTYEPPATQNGGILLDIDACPRFRPDTDVAELLANVDINARYEAMIQKSNDPIACAATYDARVAEANGTNGDAPVTGALGRQLESMSRGDLASVYILTREVTLMDEIFGISGTDVPSTISGGAAATSVQNTKTAKTAK